MPRAVGDSRTYPLSLLNSGGQAIGVQIDVPSVTTVLKALPKELSWWGYKMGLVEGRKLADAEGISVLTDSEGASALLTDDDFYEAVKKRAREEGDVQTPRNVLEQAGDRGTIVHDVAEQVFRDGTWPEPKLVPQEQHGYVIALQRWYTRKIEGKGFEVVSVEAQLVSLSKYPYIFAGTVDLILKDPNGLYHVIDFKTSKDIYESHLLQGTAYGYAAQERGIIPANAEWIATVVRLGKDGKYATKSSPCTIDDFVAVYEVYNWLCRMGWRP